MLRKKQKPSIHLIRGGAVHKAIARFHKMKIRNLSNPEKVGSLLVSFFTDAWRAQEMQMHNLESGSSTIDDFYHESVEMLAGWLKRYLASVKNGNQYPSAEVRLFSRTHRAMGIIDAIHKRNGKVSITDYKTGKSDDITHDIRVQMVIYALLYKENYGALPDIIAIDFLKTQTVKRFQVTKQFIDHAERMLADIHRKALSNDEKDYPCTCGGWCEKDFL